MKGYEERTYRLAHRPGRSVSFEARVKETDLWISADFDLRQAALLAIERHRRGLEHWLREHPGARESLAPLPPDPYAPPMVKAMLAAGLAAGTGPMAAVAGAVAQYVAQDLAGQSRRVVVENGGDLFIIGDRELRVGIWAGASPFSGKLGLRVLGEDLPLAISTSSGTVGHSLSLGRADAATVVSADGALADAVATGLGNRIKKASDMARALEWAAAIKGVLGVLAICGQKIAAWGRMELVDLGKEKG